MSKPRIEIDRGSLAKMNAAMSLAAIRTAAAAEAALTLEVQAVKTDAQGFVPVKTGEARDGIQAASGGQRGHVRATARHSNFIEHGTYKDPAQPFMAPAADLSRTRWPARAGAMIKSALGGIGR